MNECSFTRIPSALSSSEWTEAPTFCELGYFFGSFRLVVFELCGFIYGLLLFLLNHIFLSGIYKSYDEAEIESPYSVAKAISSNASDPLYFNDWPFHLLFSHHLAPSWLHKEDRKLLSGEYSRAFLTCKCTPQINNCLNSFYSSRGM
jgi:hypothetical protein